MKNQQLHFKFILVVWVPYPVQSLCGVNSFGELYLWPYTFSHYQNLMTTDKCGNLDKLVNKELWLLAPPSFHCKGQVSSKERLNFCSVQVQRASWIDGEFCVCSTVELMGNKISIITVHTAQLFPKLSSIFQYWWFSQKKNHIKYPTHTIGLP